MDKMSFIIDSQSLPRLIGTHLLKLDASVGRFLEKEKDLRENNLLTAFNDSKIDSQTIMECIFR
jgi:hypothetical protein